MSEPDTVPPPVKGEDSSSEEVVKKEREILRHEADEYPMREYSFRFMNSEIFLNPVTSFIGFCFLWGLSIWCMAQPTKANEKLGDWNTSVYEKFTWFYIAANPSFTFFVFWLAIRYGDVKLGKKDEKPEFDDASYFMMLFSAGVAVGLFFFGVSEPLSHRDSHWFANAGYRAQDEIDQFALVITLYHWGFAGWSPYIVVAVAAGVAAYRFDLPMTVRSTLYSILGDYTWGWMGDVVDGFSIVMTVAGVCTSLGLGASQIITGADRLGWIDTEELSEDDLVNKQVTVIWVITAVATLSVVSGLSVGIKLLSQIGFGLGMVLLFLCLVLEDTKYIFNLTVQSVGYYFQLCIFQIPFWTDAFGQLKEGEGRAIDGGAAEQWWMGGWTVFYMAWWTAWGAFVGLFLARISRGRTIRQVTLYSFIAPLAYSIIWFCTFGGIGLRQARQADELQQLGQTLYGDSTHFLAEGSTVCYDVPNETFKDADGNILFKNYNVGITPVCQKPGSSTDAWFNVMYSFSFKEGEDEDFNGFGPFMAGLSLIALTIYFVTSSDSGSLIVDHLSTNGHEDHHWSQRVFWAFTEGAVATALLVAGGSDALTALQAASTVFGLPFNLFLFCMMYSTVCMCRTAEAQDLAGESDGKLPAPEISSFKMHLAGGILNVVEYIVSLGRVHEDRVARGMDLPKASQVTEFLIGLFVPFVSVYNILSYLDYKPISKYGYTLVYAALHILALVLFGLSGRNFAYCAFGFVCFFSNAILLLTIRAEVRERFRLDGNFVADFAACSFFYPQALCQMMYEFEVNGDGDAGSSEEDDGEADAPHHVDAKEVDAVEA